MVRSSIVRVPTTNHGIIPEVGGLLSRTIVGTTTDSTETTPGRIAILNRPGDRTLAALCRLWCARPRCCGTDINLVVKVSEIFRIGDGEGRRRRQQQQRCCGYKTLVVTIVLIYSLQKSKRIRARARGSPFLWSLINIHKWGETRIIPLSTGISVYQASEKKTAFLLFTKAVRTPLFSDGGFVMDV